MEAKESRGYETLFIVHPEHVGKAKEYIDRFKEIIEQMGGTFSSADEWGLRNLAYRIGKQTKGYYVIMQYRSPAAVVDELERNMKIMDGVIRYLTVRRDEEEKTRKKEPRKARKSSGQEQPKPEFQA